MAAPERPQSEKSFNGPLPIPGRRIATTKDGAPAGIKPIDPNSPIGKQLRELSDISLVFELVQQNGTPDTPRNPAFHRREP